MFPVCLLQLLLCVFCFLPKNDDDDDDDEYTDMTEMWSRSQDGLETY